MENTFDWLSLADFTEKKKESINVVRPTQTALTETCKINSAGAGDWGKVDLKKMVGGSFVDL